MLSTANQPITSLVDENLATWSETDATSRRARIEAAWEPDGAIVDPPLDGYGHDGISALMAAMQQHYPGYRFVRTGEVDAHHDTFRVAWELRGPDGGVALTGVDVGQLSEDGKLSRISGFFDEMTP